MRSSRLSTSAALSSCGRLVDQQQLRLCGQSPGELQHALLAVGERARKDVAPTAESHEGEQFPCLIAAAFTIAPESASVCKVLPGTDVVVDVKTCDDVLKNGELLEQPDLLERSRDAEPHAAVGRQPGKALAREC